MNFRKINELDVQNGLPISVNALTIDGDGSATQVPIERIGTAAKPTRGAVRDAVGFTVPQEKIKTARYLGIFTQSKSSDNALVNTSASVTSGSARAIYVVPINEGDTLHIAFGWAWAQSSMQFEVNFVEPSTNVYSQTNDGTYAGFKDFSSEVSVKYAHAKPAMAFVAIRYKSTAPSTWGVKNSLYSGVADIYVTSKYQKPIGPHCIIDIHRGFPTARNNSLQAVTEAWKRAYECVELDLRSTGDGVFVMAHDDYLTGTVDDASVTKSVSGSTYEALKTLQLSNGGFTADTIATFDEMLALCENLGLIVLLDVKGAATMTDAQVKAMLTLCERHQMQDHVIFNVNGSVDCARKIREVLSTARLLFTAVSDIYDEFLSAIAPVYISLSETENAALSETEAAAITEKGYRYAVWDVTGPDLSTVLKYSPRLIEPGESVKGRYNWHMLIDEATKAQFDGVDWS